MMSSGGMTAAEAFQGKDAILSGPAGGVVGMVETARIAGFEKVIGFDMGGTSTDVAHSAGDFERAFDTEVAGVRIRAPMMRIHTVAAGGGSILHAEPGRFRVGTGQRRRRPRPRLLSARRAADGDGCQRDAGQAAAGFFPRSLRPGSGRGARCRRRGPQFAEIAAREDRSAEAVAEGFLTIAVENMANAIKKISVQRGYDVTKYLLNSFGGAAGQHACLVADALGVTSVLIHPLSGLLSAYGIGLAKVTASRQQGLVRPLDDGARTEIDRLVADLWAATCDELQAQGVPPDTARQRTVLHLRYSGADTTLPVRYDGDVEAAGQAFETAHKAQFGFLYDDGDIIVEAVDVEAEDGRDFAAIETEAEGRSSRPDAIEETRIFTGGAWRDAPVHRREKLTPGSRIAGPALIIEANQTVVVEPGWQAEVTGRDHILMRRVEAMARAAVAGSKVADPVLLEVFNNLFMNIAEQMGVALQNTAQSVNIKERLDFSCAVFDSAGALVANAPHMPVHLGSMDRSVEAVIRNNPDIRPGDSFTLNAPYNGGTHLPDITVVSPVFDGGPDVTVLGGVARASCGCGRHRPGVDDAACTHGRRGRGADRQPAHGQGRSGSRKRSCAAS